MGLFGDESKFESSVKFVPYSQQAVYDNICDLRNLEKVRDRVPEDKVNDFSFDQDTVSLNVPPVGELKLRICDREEPKCVTLARWCREDCRRLGTGTLRIT